MAHATIMPADAQPITPLSRTAIPWHGWLAVGGVACLPVGLLWDISWHSSIGRDTFWTPAHILIQLGGIVPALLFAWLALKTTFRGTHDERMASVSLWGIRAPLGAWVTMWGAAAMLTSAPFDDWWHNTYGLDVQIVSPPHSLLGFGMMAVTTGVLLFVFSRQNHVSDLPQKPRALLCALAAGVMLTLFSDFMSQFTWPNLQHSGEFYKITAEVCPFVLVLTARASQLRWPATIAAAIYMGIFMLMIWILPLFPAQPKLAPIYNPVTHMVTPAFPLLLVLPAFGIDLFMHFAARRGLLDSMQDMPDSQPDWWGKAGGRGWLLALGFASVFLVIFVPVQWFSSIFLLSDMADNAFFAGSTHWSYLAQPGDWMHRFWDNRSEPLNGKHLAAAFAIAAISSRIGLWCGNYLLKVRR